MKKIFLLASITFLLASCSDHKKDYDATGTFEATEVTVAAKSSGELKSFNLSEGQNVQANQVVGKIDDFQLQQKQEELTATEQQLDENASATSSRQLNLQEQLASLSQQITNEEKEQKRYAELVKDGAVPRKQLDDINNQINSNNTSLKKQVLAINAQKQGIKAQKRQIEDQINNTQISSPISGVVLEKYVEKGEFVSTSKPLFKVADTKTMFIRAYVTSKQLKNIKLGQKATVMADYGNGQKKQYNGIITWISSRSEFTPKTILTDDERADLVYAVKIQFQNDDYVKIGMYGEVKI